MKGIKTNELMKIIFTSPIDTAARPYIMMGTGGPFWRRDITTRGSHGAFYVQRT